MHSRNIIRDLHSQSTWKLVFYSAITAGIYTAHYIKRQTRILNKHLDRGQQISEGFISFFLIFTYLSVILIIPYVLVEDGHPFELVSDSVDKVWNIIALVWAFKFRNRMNSLLGSTPGQKKWFHGGWTFFFGFLHINFKINQLNEIEPIAPLYGEQRPILKATFCAPKVS